MMLSGPFWDLGFRPFFLVAAVSAAILLPAWVAMLAGVLPVSHTYQGFDWHIHEMIFGFAVAVLAGFLLTAARSWTKRPTAYGWLLALLVLLWLAGRAAMMLADVLPGWVVAMVDSSLLPLLAVVLARPIIAARSWRNLGFPPLLLALAATNAAMHAKAMGQLVSMGLRAPLVAVDLLLVFLAVVGTRIIPLFTANATAGLEVKRRRWADRAVVLLLLGLAAAHAVAAPAAAVAACAMGAGLLVALQLSGWGGWRALDRPILWVLHLGYLWLALGLILLAISALTPSLPRSAAVHALTSGALGTLVLGMMSRVALGHTGRELRVDGWIVVAYALIELASVVRVVMAVVAGRGYVVSLAITAGLWSFAFLIYLAIYLPILVGPRADGSRDWRQAPAAS